MNNTLKKSSSLVRAATEADVKDIVRIYTHHVLNGIATFEESPPSEAVMLQRLQGVFAAGLPWLVAECDNTIAGYAYVTLYRKRSAYRFTVEDSIYLDPPFQGQGIGKALLGQIITDCEAAGKRQMIAVIGDSDNAASIALHKSLGFHHTGILKSTGFKHGRWIDSVLMQRPLGEGGDTLPDF